MRRKLDGDAAGAGVLEVLAVRAPAGGEGVHLAVAGGDRPGVDVRVHVVDNGDTTAAALTALNSVRESGGEGSEGSSNESLGEHHFDWKRVLKRM